MVRGKCEAWTRSLTGARTRRLTEAPSSERRRSPPRSQSAPCYCSRPSKLDRLLDFYDFRALHPDQANEGGLGNLPGQLSPLEALGIWPTSEFRLSASASDLPAAVFYIGGAFALVALALALPGLDPQARRGDPGRAARGGRPLPARPRPRHGLHLGQGAGDRRPPHRPGHAGRPALGIEPLAALARRRLRRRRRRLQLPDPAPGAGRARATTPPSSRGSGRWSRVRSCSSSAATTSSSTSCAARSPTRTCATSMTPTSSSRTSSSPTSARSSTSTR